MRLGSSANVGLKLPGDLDDAMSNVGMEALNDDIDD